MGSCDSGPSALAPGVLVRAFGSQRLESRRSGTYPPAPALAPGLEAPHLVTSVAARSFVGVVPRLSSTELRASARLGLRFLVVPSLSVSPPRATPGGGSCRPAFGDA